MKLPSLLLLATALALASCGDSAPQPYDADGRLHLRLVSQFPRDSILAAGTRLFGEEIQRLMGERLRLQAFFGSSLVTAEETLGAIGHGVADAGTGMWIYAPGRLPLGSFEYHFVFNDPNFRTEARIKRELFATIPALNAELAAANIAPPLLFGPLSPYLILSREPIDSVDDLRGKRIGFTPVEYVPVFRAVGAVPILSAATEFYERLSLGVIDVVAVPVETFYLFRLHEIAPYLLNFALNTPVPLGVWVNLDYWQALAPADQAQFIEAGHRAERRYFEVLDRDVERAWQEIRAGVHITPLSEAALRDWLGRMPPNVTLWAERMDRRGLPGSEVARRYVESLQQAGWRFAAGAAQ